MRSASTLALTVLVFGSPVLLSAQARKPVDPAATEVSVGGARIELKTSAWLNLQPGPSDLPDTAPGAPLRVTARVRSMTGTHLPPGFQVDSAIVSWGHRSWAVAVVPDMVTDTAIAFRLWGGPVWLLKADSLDIIVRTHAPGRRHQYLRAPRVLLERAY